VNTSLHLSICFYIFKMFLYFFNFYLNRILICYNFIIITFLISLIMLLRIDTCSIPIGKKPGRGGELNVQGSSLSLNVLCKCNEMNSFCTLTWTLRRIHCCPLRHQEKQIRFLIKVNIIFDTTACSARLFFITRLAD
jgi:hypothetical protein